MRRLHIPLCAGMVHLLLLATATASDTGPAREALARGLEAYEAGRHEEASTAFAEAAEMAADTPLDPAVAMYNEANALLAREEHEAAAETFVASLRTTDLGLQRDAYFNRGNALMAGAAGQEAQQELEPAKGRVEEAATMFEQAMRLDPGDLDAKVNFELALKKLEELEIKQQQQEQEQQDQDQQEQQQDGQQEGDPEQQDGQQEQPQDQQQDPEDPPQQGSQDQQQDGQSDPSQGTPDEGPPEDGETQEQDGPPLPTEEMTRDEAEMLLDAKREEEKAARERVRLRLGPRQDVEKDW